jgi:hypothetical protein
MKIRPGFSPYGNPSLGFFLKIIEIGSYENWFLLLGEFGVDF